MRRHWRFAAIAVVLGCSDSGASVADAGGYTCKALQVSFDKNSSALGASNVQDAIDELAERPVAETPIGGRIKTIDKFFPNPGTHGGVSQVAECDDPRHDLALGGACGYVDGATLAETTLLNEEGNASYRCGWMQLEGSSTKLRVTVVCLQGAR